MCVIDPEGDFSTLRDVVALGNQWRGPSVSEVAAILEDPRVNVAVNILGVPLGHLPAFLAQLVPVLQAMRSRTGRPHWIVLDEAHHLLQEPCRAVKALPACPQSRSRRSRSSSSRLPAPGWWSPPPTSK